MKGALRVILPVLLLSGACRNAEAERLRAENDRLRTRVSALEAELNELRSGAPNQLNLAQVAINQHRYDEAKAALQQLIDKFPASGEARQAAQLLPKVESQIREAREEEERRRKAEEARIAEERRATERRRATAARSMAKRYDKLEGISWYQDKSTHSYQSSFHLYFADHGGYVGNLRLKLRYYDDDWLFIHGFTVYADGQRFEYPNVEFERDHGSGSIWEWYDTPLSATHLSMVRAVLAAKEATVRYHGRQYRDDRTITAAQRSALQRVLDAYVAMGGSLP